MLTQLFRDLNYEGAGQWFMTDDEYASKLLRDNAIQQKLQTMVADLQNKENAIRTINELATPGVNFSNDTMRPPQNE